MNHLSAVMEREKEIGVIAVILQTSEFMALMLECSIKTKQALNYSKC